MRPMAAARLLPTLLGWCLAQDDLAASEDGLAAMAVDDECHADSEKCTLSALQLRGDAGVADDAQDEEGWLRPPDALNVEADGPEEEAETLEFRQVSNSSVWRMGPPNTATQYNGVAWEDLVVHGNKAEHIFAIGDWGGLLGSASRAMVFYHQCHSPGPHTFPRSRPGCKMKPFDRCFDSNGRSCDRHCGYINGVDDKAQQLVAEQMKRRAGSVNPSYVLNVGDNFYQGGIWWNCGTNMHQLSSMAHQQFSHVWQGVYGFLAQKPWFSVLGNHDWGGWQFNHAWDQQIAYSWHNPNWVMPAVYWSRTVQYPDQGFNAEFFMLDSNAMDAKPGDADPEHNICGPHNPGGANCARCGGPPNKGACFSWFQALWREEQHWLEKKLAESTAHWQVVVTHFPCGFQAHWFRMLHGKLGLDLLVSGHRHDQELWPPGRLGGLACFVTGGGGGITSEGVPRGSHTSQYGFFDIGISKAQMTVESINLHGHNIGSLTVHPKHTGRQGTAHGGSGGQPESRGGGVSTTPGIFSSSCAAYGCVGFSAEMSCQCNSKCRHYNNCCHDYEHKCR